MIGNYFTKSHLFAYDGGGNGAGRDTVVFDKSTVDDADNTVIVYNNANSGDTTSDFLGLTSKQDERDGTHWENLLKNVRPGDYVFIGFCHNDQTQISNKDYISNLRKMVADVKAKYANPVIYTPIVRLEEDADGLCGNSRFNDTTYGDKMAALKDFAKNNSVPIIDLTSKTQSYIRSLGNDYDTQYAKGLKLYMQDVIDNNSNYKALDGALASRYVDTGSNGVELDWGSLEADYTHTTRFGADVYASLLAQGIKENKQLSDLAKWLKEDLTSPTWESYEAYYNN